MCVFVCVFVDIRVKRSEVRPPESVCCNLTDRILLDRTVQE